jgi:hypothetical protein
MTASLFAQPKLRWLALALTACLVLIGLAATSVQAAQKPSLETVTLCIQQGGPEKGSIRFVKATLRCLKGEKRVIVLTTKGQQGVLGIEAGSGSTWPRGRQWRRRHGWSRRIQRSYRPGWRRW